MRSLPVRYWLWLLLSAVIAVPVVTSLAVVITRPPPPPIERWADHTVTPQVRTLLADPAADWASPAWQSSLDEALASASLEVMLIDETGRVVYRSTDAPTTAPRDSIAPGGLAVILDPASTAGHGTAILSPAPGPPVDRRMDLADLDLWRIPIAQIAALVLIVAAIALLVNYAFLRPLTELITAMRRVGSGDLETRLPRSRVTEVDQVAQAFGSMADELRQSLEREQALELERRMTIGALVHDLRTPLFSLRGYLEGIATGVAGTPERQARYLQLAREKADVLERLVFDLFEYTRAEYLREVPRPEQLDLGDLLRRTIEGLQPQADARGVQLELAGETAPLVIPGDPMLLTRAVENLLDNAVRYTPEGGDIQVRWAQSHGQAEFSVADSGPGISPEDLAHIFAPLYRGETSRNRRTGGAGLGLAIARRLIRAHGGELTASNGPHGGAIFTAVLPMQEHGA